MPGTGDIDVRLTLVDADDDDLDVGTAALRRQLLELDVAGVARPTAPAPEGTRGLDGATIGSLVVTLASQQAVLGAVLSTVASWVGRRGTRKVRIQIGDDLLELDGVSAEDQRRLLDTFIERHSGQATWPDDAQH